MPTAPEPVKKEKKTRRRLRLSCVECTKRRQRCDRVYPCGLCVSRGVSHLCRWENVPVARPTPARPPVVPASATTASTTDSIQQLTARIATLEQTVVAERLRNRALTETHLDTLSGSSPHSSSRGLSLPNDYSPHNSVVSLQSPSSANSPYSSPEPYSQEDESERISATPLPDSVYQTASSMAQQSIAHYGEYIGGGSSLSALYSISSKATPRLPHVTSTETSVLFQSVAPNDISSSLSCLIQSLPSSSVVGSLCQVFFKDANWRFGIPEEWFHNTCAAMWNSIRYTASPVQINPNWLSLLFAVLAIAPRNNNMESTGDVGSAENFFTCALTARRIAESAYMARPTSARTSAALGSVLSCLAVPLLCDYLAERGRVSEAWKLVGHAILCAEAVGMHRDPGWGAWQKMSEDIMSDEEKLLRRRAWWGLFIWERMYALVLGRPTVIRNEAADVVVPAPINADGTRNFFNVYQRVFIQLLHLAGETVEKCFGVASPPSAAVRELDRKFEQWESQLPPEFRSDIRSEYQNMPDDLDASDLVALSRQRYTLSTWYLLCRSKLHVSYITSQNDTAFLNVWAGHPLSRKRSRNLCISLATELIKLQCNALSTAARSQNEPTDGESVLTGSNWRFAGCFSLFEAAITLATLLPQHSWQGRPGDPDTLVQQAMIVLMQIANEQSNKSAIARMGSEALAALIQELSGRANEATMTPTSFNSFDSSTTPPFIASVGSTPPLYEWYSSETTTFGLSTEFAGQPPETKPRYNMEMQLPMLMPYEETKVGLMYDTGARG